MCTIIEYYDGGGFKYETCRESLVGIAVKSINDGMVPYFSKEIIAEAVDIILEEDNRKYKIS